MISLIRAAVARGVTFLDTAEDSSKSPLAVCSTNELTRNLGMAGASTR
jgi:hypothetical protein